jgi:hypothetical protein
MGGLGDVVCGAPCCMLVPPCACQPSSAGGCSMHGAQTPSLLHCLWLVGQLQRHDRDLS